MEEHPSFSVARRSSAFPVVVLVMRSKFLLLYCQGYTQTERVLNLEKGSSKDETFKDLGECFETCSKKKKTLIKTVISKERNKPGVIAN